MRGEVRIGHTCRFRLRNAVLIYGDGSGAFATLHDVRGEKEGAPYLGPGQSLTTAFLRSLAHGLGVRMAPEILPDNILARTPDLIAWWTKAQHRCMFFGGGSDEAATLNGRMYPASGVGIQDLGPRSLRACACGRCPAFGRNTTHDGAILEYRFSRLRMPREHAGTGGSFSTIRYADGNQPSSPQNLHTLAAQCA